MILAWTFALLSQTAPPAEPAVRVVLRGSEIVLRSGTKVDRIPLQTASDPPKPASNWPPDKVLFRKDGAYAVWDSRGLSVRQGAWVFTSQLVEIPLSPKLFSKEEILDTKARIANGRRNTVASGIVGALRDGPRVYFLARWDEDEKPWLEALVAVDLSEDKPKPKLLGRFEGLSLDFFPDKSRLFVRDGKPSVLVRNDRQWGLAQFESEETRFLFEMVGERPDRVELVDGRIGWFTGKTEYGATILHRWDSKTLSRRELVETRGRVRLMDTRSPWIAVIHEDEGSFLQNLDTGGRQRLPSSAGFRWSAFGVAVWTPATRPTKVVVYDPVKWNELGRWPTAR